MDTGILLRNHFTRVGVEMWVKVYSPNVAGIEVVQRKEKRARRARLYYMRYGHYLSCGYRSGIRSTTRNDVLTRRVI